MSIEVINLTKKFGAQIAVNNISFNIASGNIVGFLGPNGAGKSTTMKMITGYAKPSSGAIKVCGLDVENNALAIQKKIGYLPESNPHYPEMYVREYLEFLASLHKLGSQSKGRIDDMISITGLAPEVHKKIGMLSKGYKQRVGLAQAMLHNPEVLILDEPTSGLDPNQIVEIRDLIINIGKEKTVLLSTHIMQEVSAMCSRIIIINKGNIVADNSIENIVKQGNSESQSVIFSTKQILHKELFQNSKNVINITQPNTNTLQLVSNNADDLKKEILAKCLELNLDIISISSNSNSLEEIFRQLTNISESVAIEI
jgi:ABC-2 type transport system ATP-binding protein